MVEHSSNRHGAKGPRDDHDGDDDDDDDDDYYGVTRRGDGLW